MKVMNIVDQIDIFKKNNYQNDHHNDGIVVPGQKTVSVSEREPGYEEIIKAVDQLNKSIENLQDKVTFSYHEKTHTIVMKVHDSETNEIIREIPAKSSIRLLEHIQEYLGLFIDESR